MKKFYSVFLFFYYFNSIQCVGPESRIVSGRPALVGQFPFAAAIEVQTPNSRFFCGGALTGNQWVITAGHCVNNATLFTIQLGLIHLEGENPGSEKIATSEYILHPDFNPDTIENDIGIIKFRQPIQYTNSLAPIDPWEEEVGDGAFVQVLGWGQTTDTNAELSNTLQFAPITTISNTECRIFYGNQVTDNMVCVAGNSNEGTCIGDNGSPLVISFGRFCVLVGISSFISSGGCESTLPSGYTRTFPYRDWIMNITGEELVYIL